MSHRNIFYYDSRDNLTCVRDPDLGLTYYTYDAGSRMTSVKNPFGEVTYYEYRLDGQVSKKTLGNGCVTYYEFDDIGRTTKVDNRNDRLKTGARIVPVPRVARTWNYGYAFAHYITWQPGSKRISDTETATKDYIADWLSHTCCGRT